MVELVEFLDVVKQYADVLQELVDVLGLDVVDVDAVRLSEVEDDCELEVLFGLGLMVVDIMQPDIGTFSCKSSAHKETPLCCGKLSA